MGLTLRAIEALLPNRRKKKKHAVEQATAAPGELREVGTDPYFGVRPNRLAPGIKKRG